MSNEDMPLTDLFERVANAANADTDDFGELCKILDLSPQTDFIGADLSGLNLSGQSLIGYDFSNADLSECEFSRAFLKDCKFSNCLIVNTRFSYSVIENGDFRNARVINTTFEDTPLEGADFRDCRLNKTIFIKCPIKYSDFRYSNLSDDNIHKCTFNDVKFDSPPEIHHPPNSASKPLNAASLTSGSLGSGSVDLGDGVAPENVPEVRLKKLLKLDLETNSSEWATEKRRFANSYLALGRRFGNTDHIQEAERAIRQILDHLDREKSPIEWARTQNDLGSALRAAGELETGTGSLEEAVDAYTASLEEYMRDRMPVQWAMTTTDLGLTYMNLAERGRPTIENALTCLADALEVFHDADTNADADARDYITKCTAALSNALALRDRLNAPS